MLEPKQKHILYSTMYRIIAQCPYGINTRTLVESTIDTLSDTISHLSCWHAFGMLTYMTQNCDVRFLQRIPGNSVVAL